MYLGMNVEGGGCTEGDGECPLNHSYGGTGSAWMCVGSPKGHTATGLDIKGPWLVLSGPIPTEAA